MTKVVYFCEIRTQEPNRYTMSAITTIGTPSPSAAAQQTTPSPATPRLGVESPVKRMQRALSLEKEHFKPLAFSMTPDALSAVSVAAQKQLAKGRSDLDASISSLAARKVSAPR